MTKQFMNGTATKIVILTIAITLLGCTKEPEVAVREEIPWLYDIEVGLQKAREENKPVLVDFMATWCPPCKAMEDSTFSNKEVIAKMAAFIPVRIDVDKQAEIANKYNGNAAKYGGVGIPNILFMTGDETKLKHIIGFRGPNQFGAVIDSVLSLK